MTGDPGESSIISRRRELLEEVLVERSKAVAALPIDAQDPHPRSPLWPLGIGRMAGRVRFSDDHARRHNAVNLCVIALAWLESVDAELRARAECPGA